MIQISEATLEKVIIHRIGNKMCNEPLVLSHNVLEKINSPIDSILMHYFFSEFKGNNYFTFTHPSDIKLNDIYSFCCDLFEDDSKFAEMSESIARHLYETTDHPNIKEGELYVALIRDVVVETEVCDAIGLFKSESKDTYLKITDSANGLGLENDRGINIHKLDKGCLIFNTERDNGLKVCAVDNTNKSSAAVYWKEAFLRIKPKDDDYYQAKQVVDLCKSFVKDAFNSENEVSKVDQIVMLNRASDFIKTNEVFNVEDFKQVVMKEPEVIEAFEEYKEKFESLNQVSIKDEFCIPSSAVKESKKQFKSVVKLDKNFHLYIHSDDAFIQRGYDAEAGKKFIKLFYDEES